MLLYLFFWFTHSSLSAPSALLVSGTVTAVRLGLVPKKKVHRKMKTDITIQDTQTMTRNVTVRFVFKCKKTPKKE